MKRGGNEIAVSPRDFANPLVRGSLENSTSGSSGNRTATQRSLEYDIYHEALQALGVRQFATPKHVFVGLMPVLPSTGGLCWMTYLPRLGYRVDRWYALGGKIRDSFHHQALTNFMVLESRTLGVKTPFPTLLRENDFLPVAKWIARRQSEGVDCILRTGVSRAVRVAGAALDHNLDISGAQFLHGKLTGQGTTLVGSDLLNLVEKILPDKFGGTPVDYQLVEREGNNQTEIELRVHPRVGVRSADEVKAFFLEEIKKLWGGPLTLRWWKQTDGVHVVLAEPYVSGGHKVLPLHLMRTSQARQGRPH